MRDGFLMDKMTHEILSPKLPLLLSFFLGEEMVL